MYFSLVILLHLPPVQGFLGREVSNALSAKLGTKVSVGRIDLGLLNRFIIDDVVMLDQRGDSMLRASRVAAKIDLLAASKGKITVSSAQLFGLRANLYRKDANTAPNFLFVLDSLASKEPSSQSKLDIRINSLIIRNGSIKYDQQDIANHPGAFSPQHIYINKLSAHIVLNHLTNDSIDLYVKKLSLADKSGLTISSLRTRLMANKREAQLTGFELNMPGTTLTLKDVWAKYRMGEKGLDKNSLSYGASIYQSRITLSDFAALVPEFKQSRNPFYLDLRAKGTDKQIEIPTLRLRAGNGSLNLDLNGFIKKYGTSYEWRTNIANLNLRADGVKFIADNFNKRFTTPKELIRMGNIHYEGQARGIGKEITSKGNLASSAGNAYLDLSLRGNHLKGTIQTDGFKLGDILDEPKLGDIATRIQVDGTKDDVHAEGNIERITFDGYTYRDIIVDADYLRGIVEGNLKIDDPHLSAELDGSYNTKSHNYMMNANLKCITPSVILKMKTVAPLYQLTDISVQASNEKEDEYLILTSPFADIYINGNYDYATIAQSVTNLIGSKLPTLPNLPPVNHSANNNFSIQAIITDTEALNELFGIPMTINMPVTIEGMVRDKEHTVDLTCSLPSFIYDGNKYADGYVRLTTPNDTLKADVSVKRLFEDDRGPSIKLKATAADNKLTTELSYRNDATKLPVTGQLNTDSYFYKGMDGQATAHVNVLPSSISLGDTRWDIQPSDIIYKKNHLSVNHFAIRHGAQYITINGTGSLSDKDSLEVDLRDVDVAYVLDLVNFHSVGFSGKASGKAFISALFGTPDAKAKLNVEDFHFEEGRMGVLHANVGYDPGQGKIDIEAVADDGPEHQTVIAGNVSPKHNTIDLGIIAQGTRLEFLRSFCGSFLGDIEAWGKGRVSLIGELDNINLVGGITAHGKARVTPLEVDYSFDNLQVKAIPDEIIFLDDSIFDRDRHYGILSGSIHHKHLTNLTYDLSVEAHNLLSYNTREFGDNTFYGTVYADGRCGIHGKAGETVIDIDVTPRSGSQIVYNVASPEYMGEEDFIEWNDITPTDSAAIDTTSPNEQKELAELPSDLYINFTINATPDLTLRLIMDPETGDYIALNGDGAIRATYFDKGGFSMFGNYVVDHGVYKLTIQNILKKDFDFLPGGTISFGGDAYQAALNLQARHVVNSVPLSDLSIGRSFSGNNVRVDCIMDITGTPEKPKVDFSLDLPTVSNDVKQMVYSVINGQEEMNQQVVYLLGVGRFMVDENNRQSSSNQQSETSLAMQSLLSGTISQQINSVLGGLINDNNWNLGANISTGDEGFNNAEYEGILSGRMLNNRLTFTGQFGYRDNPNATTSFIGDFDLRYNLTPNGNIAVRVYNQSNDRYFTRNSLNTQGLGFIFKKDFFNLRDLFGLPPKKKKKNDEQQ